MFEELKKMNEELTELKKNHLERSKLMFTEVSKKVFEKHPKLESFGWTQYTPYFNDGEECTFSAHTDYPSINGINADDADFSRKKLTELGAAESDVKEFLQNIDEAALRDMFGDHVKVEVTPNGTEVFDYEHE